MFKNKRSLNNLSRKLLHVINFFFTNLIIKKLFFLSLTSNSPSIYQFILKLPCDHRLIWKSFDTYPSGSSLGSCGIRAGASVFTGPDPEPPRSLEIRLMTIWPRTLSLSSALFLWRSSRWTAIEIRGWGDWAVWALFGLCTHTDTVCPSRDPFPGILTRVQWWAVIHQGGLPNTKDATVTTGAVSDTDPCISENLLPQLFSLHFENRSWSTVTKIKSFSPLNKQEFTPNWSTS